MHSGRGLPPCVAARGSWVRTGLPPETRRRSTGRRGRIRPALPRPSDVRRHEAGFSGHQVPDVVESSAKRSAEASSASRNVVMSVTGSSVENREFFTSLANRSERVGGCLGWFSDDSSTAYKVLSAARRGCPWSVHFSGTTANQAYLNTSLEFKADRGRPRGPGSGGAHARFGASPGLRWGGQWGSNPRPPDPQSGAQLSYGHHEEPPRANCEFYQPSTSVPLSPCGAPGG